MGAISQKKKGRAWAMREHSLRTYEAWVPELEQMTGQSIPFNQDGLVYLTFDDEDGEKVGDFTNDPSSTRVALRDLGTR